MWQAASGHSKKQPEDVRPLFMIALYDLLYLELLNKGDWQGCQSVKKKINKKLVIRNCKLLNLNYGIFF